MKYFGHIKLLNGKSHGIAMVEFAITLSAFIVVFIFAFSIFIEAMNRKYQETFKENAIQYLSLNPAVSSVYFDSAGNLIERDGQKTAYNYSRKQEVLNSLDANGAYNYDQVLIKHTKACKNLDGLTDPDLSLDCKTFQENETPQISESCVCEEVIKDDYLRFGCQQNYRVTTNELFYKGAYYDAVYREDSIGIKCVFVSPARLQSVSPADLQ